MRDGTILHEQAYAQGKMLDHSGWSGKLPRKITPSDIDFVFDNRGSFLFGELTKDDLGWAGLNTGQQMLYQHLLNGTSWIAVLCHHSVPSDRQIDTYADIDSFIPMIWANGKMYQAERFVGVERWQKFVISWFDDPLKIYKWLCEHS
jgi:hypothetical protein